MMIFTADPQNPLGRRSGSLAGSGTHDEHTVVDDHGAHDEEIQGDASEVAQAAGAGATELAAWITARGEEVQPQDEGSGAAE